MLNEHRLINDPRLRSMLMSLDGNESGNFFPGLWIKILEVEYQEVLQTEPKICHLSYSTLRHMPWTTWTRNYVTSWASHERQRQLPLKSFVGGRCCWHHLLQCHNYRVPSPVCLSAVSLSLTHLQALTVKTLGGGDDDRNDICQSSPMAFSALQHWTASPPKEGCHWQAGGENRRTWQLANPAWYP